MSVKIYTEEPKRNPARKAWRFLTKNNGWSTKPPKEMFFSPCSDGERNCWVAYWGEWHSYGTYGATSGGKWAQVTASSLNRFVLDDGEWNQEAVARQREALDKMRKRWTKNSKPIRA